MHTASPARRAARACAAVGGAALALSLVGAAAPASADGTTLAPDEIATSRNVQHLFNAPKGALQGTNSDLAFQGDYAFQGNYEGFVVWNISDPDSPVVVSETRCPGAQNDVTVHGDLLFLSTDSRRTDDTCASAVQSDPTALAAGAYWEGIKVFDISNPASPRYVKAVETKCGSHTHTLVPGQTDDTVYLYVSSYDINPAHAKCQPPHDLVSIVEVPVGAPQDAALVEEALVFPDGGNVGDPVDTPFIDRSRATAGCHDITVFPEQDLAAGACMGDGVLWDISDRTRLVELDRVQDNENFAFWHSATFNNSGTKLVFTDELGGGGAATCVAGFNPKRGANGIYDVVGAGADRELVFRSYYKIDRAQADTENCVAHNGSLIPVPGKDLMVQSWYMGGVSVWDFTDSSNPREIGFFERGPVKAGDRTGGGTWSAYWYNGFVYSSDLGKGFDVLKVTGREVARAQGVKYDVLNVQTQPVYSVKPGRR